MAHRETDHLIKVAVEDFTLPTHIDRVAAHEPGNGAGIEAVLQQGHVFGEPPVVFQPRREPADRHVGDGVEPVKLDAEVFAQGDAVIILQFLLSGWKERSVGVINEVEDERRRAAIAEFVQPLKPGDAPVEDPVAALLVDVLDRKSVV